MKEKNLSYFSQEIHLDHQIPISDNGIITSYLKVTVECCTKEDEDNFNGAFFIVLLIT